MERGKNMLEMKHVSIKAFDIPESWYKLLKFCSEHGTEWIIQRGSRAGQKRKEFDSVSVQITSPWFEPRLPEVPEGIPPPTDPNFVNEYMPYFMCGGKIKAEEDYTYGERINEFPLSAEKTLSQVNHCIQMLKKTPQTNQACIAIAMPTDILLNEPPCMRELDFRIRYEKLHAFTYFRSWDLWGGYPTNIPAIQQLKEYMAKEIGVADGEILAFSKGLHIYETEWTFANEVVKGRRLS